MIHLSIDKFFIMHIKTFRIIAIISNDCKQFNENAGFDIIGKSIIHLTFVTDLSILDFGEQLLTLEPPLSENDYSFSLGTEEGLSDLFDFKF